jgi:antitoxin component of MazEF toxin-antitoxin module
LENENKNLPKEDSEKRNKYTLEELLAGITEENRHEEIFTDRQGRELI